MNQNAFGEWFNNNAALFVSDGALLVNTWDFVTGSKVYRYKGGKKWVRETAPGFGNPKTILTSLYHYLESSPNLAMVSAYNPVGFELWSRFAGGQWARVARASTLNLSSAYVYAGSAIRWKQDLYFVAGNIGGFKTEVPMKLFRGKAHPSVAVSYTSQREVRLTFAHPKGWYQGLKIRSIKLAIFFPGYGWVGNIFDKVLPLFKVIGPVSPTKIVLGLSNIAIPRSWRFKISVRSYNGEFTEAQR